MKKVDFYIVTLPDGSEFEWRQSEMAFLLRCLLKDNGGKATIELVTRELS